MPPPFFSLAPRRADNPARALLLPPSQRGLRPPTEVTMRLLRVPPLFPMLAILASPTLAFGQHYNQTNLVSDTGGAQATDPNLRNAWGLVHGPSTPWWISNNATGTSTVYDASTTPVTVKPTIVTIPAPAGQSGTGTPTGIVYNGSSTDFLLAPGKAAIFIWVTEDGTVAAWNPGVNPTQAVLKADNSQKPSPGAGAVYKGVTIAVIDGQRYVLAANFRSGHIDAFDNAFSQVRLDKHAFEDERLPRGFAPFNIESLGDNIVVTYAKQDATAHDDVAGPGLGYVVIFSREGDVVARLQHGPWLNSPWGVALAPADFGVFSHALLVGNFGDGTIAAFNPVSGRFLGNLLDAAGSKLTIAGLWGLSFGNGGASGPGNTLFFTAGPNDESDGLFGTLMPVAAELNAFGGQ
jgi:uncharacterized protein (TIGR03118 family)